MIPSLILKAIRIEVGCMIVAAYISGIKIWVGLMCWTLWSCDRQSDVLDFVVM